MRISIGVGTWLTAAMVLVGTWINGCGSDSEVSPNGSSSTGTSSGSNGGGGGGSCDPQATELCDGIDNNCDEQVDEGCPCVEDQTQECYTGDSDLVGIGVCAMGVQTCDIQGTWGVCEDEVLPSEEVCDGEDNDCNDLIDEDLGTVTCGLGICQVTVEACDEGVPVPCLPGTPNPSETCDGTDDDCDGDVDEGCNCVDETQQSCYTGSLATQNVGACHDGLQTCSDGQWGGCVGDQTPAAFESCNDLDDDCDGDTDEGDPGGGATCDTGLEGVCAPGVEHCVDGSVDCVQNVQPSAELCDGLDNDCDSSTADGAGETWLGAPCDGADSDACLEGTYSCVNGAQSCSDDDSENDLDLCNGSTDDDCDPATPDGSGETWFGAACDGADTDACLEGIYSCVGGVQSCSDDDSENDLDLCNGSSTDDCDPATPDGSGETWFGAACDGADTDLCEEGVYNCVSGAQSCNDNDSENDLDLCNGDTMDDCNAATPDGSGETWLGAACDGADTDLCAEGTYSCVNGAQSCSDNDSENDLDLCNGNTMDDCNAATPDGSQDPAVGQACDGSDSDYCLEGYTSCVSGALACSDNTSGTTELCAGDNQDEDCDGSIDEGYTRNDNPACSSATYIGAVSGDDGADILTRSWYNEEWYEVLIREDYDGIDYLSATVELYSPPGTDFDLYVYCDGCSGGLAGSSTAGGQTGHYDTVEVRNDDDWGWDDSFYIIIEVRHFSSSYCANWELTLTSYTSVSDETCDS